MVLKHQKEYIGQTLFPHPLIAGLKAMHFAYNGFAYNISLSCSCVIRINQKGILYLYIVP